MNSSIYTKNIIHKIISTEYIIFWEGPNIHLLNILVCIYREVLPKI